MKIQRDEDRPLIAPNMTPLVDMLFILIVFFLATSRFQQEERDQSIELVKSKSSLPLATARSLLVIDIDKEGRKMVNGREKTLEEIEAIIRQRAAEDKEAEIVLRADRRARVAHLEETTEICHRLGITTPKISYGVAGD